MLVITFLGTSSMVPTKERNQTAVFISYGAHGILIDCGEGTQRQFKLAGIPITKVTKLLITHWHGDHVLGIPGLIQTLAASEYKKTLEIYGPKNTKKHFKLMLETFIFDKSIDMKIQEIDKGKFFENEEYSLECLPLKHGIMTLGYNFIEKDKLKIDMRKVRKFRLPQGPLLGKLQSNEVVVWKGKKIKPEEVTYVKKGKKVTLIADTLLCDNCYKLAKNADLLICEATYSSKLKNKSMEYEHMTAMDAAFIANKANVKKLVLTHFSARYKTTDELENEARNIFNNTICAYDFMKIRL